MEEERFITEYNKLINRIKKAEEFLESDTYIGKDKKPHKYQSLEEEIRYKEKWIPEYQKLIKETAEKLEKDGSGASLEKLIEHIRQSDDFSKLGTIKEQFAKVKEINQRLAATEVDNLIKNSTKMGSPLAKAYMTGITV